MGLAGPITTKPIAQMSREVEGFLKTNLLLFIPDAPICMAFIRIDIQATQTCVKNVN